MLDTPAVAFADACHPSICLSSTTPATGSTLKVLPVFKSSTWLLITFVWPVEDETDAVGVDEAAGAAPVRSLTRSASLSITTFLEKSPREVAGFVWTV